MKFLSVEVRELEFNFTFLQMDLSEYTNIFCFVGIKVKNFDSWISFPKVYGFIVGLCQVSFLLFLPIVERA